MPLRSSPARSGCLRTARLTLLPGHPVSGRWGWAGRDERVSPTPQGAVERRTMRPWPGAASSTTEAPAGPRSPSTPSTARTSPSGRTVPSTSWRVRTTTRPTWGITREWCGYGGRPPGRGHDAGPWRSGTGATTACRESRSALHRSPKCRSLRRYTHTSALPDAAKAPAAPTPSALRAIAFSKHPRSPPTSRTPRSSPAPRDTPCSLPRPAAPDPASGSTSAPRSRPHTQPPAPAPPGRG